MKTMIAVLFAATSLLGSNLAMAQPYSHDDARSGWGPPTGTQSDLREQIGAGGSGF